LARLRFNDEVEQIDIDEAIRLSEVSRNMINEDIAAPNKISFNAKGDPISTVFLIIREMCTKSKDKTVKLEDIERKIVNKNINKQILQDCIEQYHNLDIIYVDKNRTEITLV
jgi:DNA replication licensing factor MCM7